MRESKRLVYGLLLAALVLLSAGALTWWRLSLAQRQGWAGMTYMPPIPAPKGKKAQAATLHVGPFSPGSVMFVYPGGPADSAGMKRGGSILSIDKVPLADMAGINRLAGEVRSGRTVVYRTREGKVERDHAVRFAPPLRTPLLVADIAVSEIVGLTFFLIGVFVFARRPADPRATVFFSMTLFATICFASAALAPLEAQNMRGLAVTSSQVGGVARPLAIALAGMFFAPFLLHLALIFPKPRPVIARRRRLFLWIYGYPVYVSIAAALIILIITFANWVRESSLPYDDLLLWCIFGAISAAGGVGLWRVGVHARRSGTRDAVAEHPLAVLNVLAAVVTVAVYLLGRLTVRTHSPMTMVIASVSLVFLVIASLIVYPISTFVALFRSYRDSNAEERRQVKWPLWGTMFAVGGKILLTVVAIACGYLVFQADVVVPGILMTAPELLGKLLYVLIPISFAFAILKYRLMNIDVIIRRTVLYTILSAVVFVLYGALVAGVGTLVIRFTRVQNTTMVIASTIVVALVAVPLRNRLQHMVDRNLFRERRDYPLALRNIGNAIGSRDVDAFLGYTAEQLQQALQTRFVAIALRREGYYVISAKVGIADELVGRLRIPEDAVDLTRRDRIPEELRRLGTIFIAPVSVHRDPFGLIAIGSKLSDQELNDDDLQFLDSAASQIALGIENSRLRTEEAEFAQARAIQQVLLPTHFPRLDGFQITGKWQPARSVAGDYFDTLALGEGKAAVCIGDVAGKGMPAALLMANLQAAVKATAGPDVAPSQLCENVKRVVGDNLAGGKFITFFYGVVDSAARTLTYTNAGHNPPILARASGEVERLTRGGPAFCRLFRDEAHEQETVALGPGDRLVLFTDGASEARRGEEEFGEDRLAALIATHRSAGADELQEKIVVELTAFASGNFADDVTLVVVAAV